MTQPSGWATATRSYDDQGFPVSTSAPEAPPLAPQSQQNSKVGSKTAASGGAKSYAPLAPCGLWLWLTAPLLMFFAGVVFF